MGHLRRCFPEWFLPAAQELAAAAAAAEVLRLPLSWVPLR